MNSFPKYKYPYKRCVECNQQLKPKYIQNNLRWTINKKCCAYSLFRIYGLKNYFRLIHVRIDLDHRIQVRIKLHEISVAKCN